MCWDFNEILADNEKQGGAPCPVRQVQAFHDVVREYGFSEMQSIGPRFTWSRRNGSELIAERLDRGFANDEF